MLFQPGYQGSQKTWCAEAALQSMRLPEGLLKGMHIVNCSQPFYCCDLMLMDLAKAFLAELALRQGRCAEAGRWAKEVDLGTPGGVFRFYVPHVTRAKILIDEEAPEATRYLEQLTKAYASSHSHRVLMDVLPLQALLADRMGDPKQANHALQRALALALPGGSLRFLIDMGPEAARLLHGLELEGEPLQFAGRILAGFQTSTPRGGDRETGGAPDPRPRSLLDPLSAREMQVLALMADHLSNKEISERLYISLSTVKSHTKRIYGKLAVHGRREAVTKARGLGLLPMDGPG